LKLQSKIQVKAKDKVFGGDKLLECIPMVSRNKEELLRDIQEIVSHNPDIIEWRIDYYDKLENISHVVESLKQIAPLARDIPILLTFRHVSEGGYKEERQQTRLEVIQATVETGLIDVVDVENANEASFIEKVKEVVRKNHVKLILSNHNFKETPSEQWILDSLKTGKELGADIVKIAIMPQNFSDVVTLACATYRARKEILDIPLITVSMGELGSITRIMGGEIGSDLSFFSSSGSSGPGQINIEDYRCIKDIIQDKFKW